LQKLRKQILAAAPKCEEYFSYGMPGFKYNGHPMLYIGAAKHHCALYGTVPKGFEESAEGLQAEQRRGAVHPEEADPSSGGEGDREREDGRDWYAVA
jgi:uncharacterized protein YdhG (YjbR/CyaY superfamily)